jgi:hypothetical protein
MSICLFFIAHQILKNKTAIVYQVGFITAYIEMLHGQQNIKFCAYFSYRYCFVRSTA